MPRELPIFPLPLVLFPGTLQPLHIFEPRYRQLLADSLAGDRRFGVTYAAESPGQVRTPRPGDVGCVAEIRSTQDLPDGRSNIVTVGERRFTLLDWLPTARLYRLARVEEFADEHGDPVEVSAIAAEVRRDFMRLLTALAALTDRPEEPPTLPDEPELLSFQVAAELEFEPPAKLELLRVRSTLARLHRLAALLAPLAADAERRATVRRHARRNGKSGLPADIERTAP
ncbi:MAG: LON peptidase substrate-binding domain-containing protein [Gemmatimonadales bacterium]